MLRVQRFPEILKSVLTDGIEGVLLMTTDGSVLSSVSINGNAFTETVVAAVSSCIFSNYYQGILLFSYTKLKFTLNYLNCRKFVWNEYLFVKTR